MKIIYYLPIHIGKFEYSLISVYIILYLEYLLPTTMAYQSNLPEIKVYENITIDTVVIGDMRSLFGIAQSVHLKLGPGSLNRFFRLDNQSGNLITKAKLDLESTELCEVEKSCCRTDTLSALFTNSNDKIIDHSYGSVQATVGEMDQQKCTLMAFLLALSDGETQISPIAKLFVTILDLNDNAPQFRSHHSNNLKPIEISFTEGPSSIGAKHDLPTAYDADFSIENRVKQYWIEWLHKDSKNFKNEYKYSKLSNVLPNAVTTQSMTNHFKLGPFRLIYTKSTQQLSIQLEYELDCEEQSQYHLKLVSQDGGGLIGSNEIVINVEDVNEYIPVFVDVDLDSALTDISNAIYTGNPNDNQQLYQNLNFLTPPTELYKKQYKVKESLEIGSKIGMVRAIDRDVANFSHITYHFGLGSPNLDISRVFNLNSQNGLITLRSKLDYETVRNYRLTIVAKDGATMDDTNVFRHSKLVHSATAIVEIVVLDVNDHTPDITFEKEDPLQTNKYATFHSLHQTSFNRPDKSKMKTYEVWIKENLPKNTPITFFNVHDRDSGLNSRVDCQLKNLTDQFVLREFSGLYAIETLVNLDRELVEEYYVTIECRDMGEPVLYTQRILWIHLLDVNDLPPYFPYNTYQFRVLENSPPNTVLKAVNSAYPEFVKAIDPDLNSTLNYRLEAVEIKTYNTNSTASGGANVNKDLDRLNSIYAHTLDYQLFAIDSVTGQLRTQGELDREQNARLEFSVCADDGLHSACTNVIVDLEDVNDNPPRFERDTYVIRLEENLFYYKPILLFNVIDPDIGNSGFVFTLLDDLKDRIHYTNQNDTFSKTSNTRTDESKLIRKHFLIRDNGLYLQQPLDREERANYHFYVQVTDLQATMISKFNGNITHNLSSHSEIFIDVTDVNDNSPVFVFPNTTTIAGNRLSVSCHETMGSSIGQLQATDLDLGLNGSVTFTLIQTVETEQLFHLDAISGELFVNTGQLNKRCGTNVILLVSVDDQGLAESKVGRNAPMERLVIKFEDKPTIVEMVVAQNKQHWNSAGVNDAGLLIEPSGGLDKHFLSHSISAKTILSVILGGSTIFLVGLLIVSIILLMYNRSRKRKHLIKIHELQLNRPINTNSNLKQNDQFNNLQNTVKYFPGYSIKGSDTDEQGSLTIHLRAHSSHENFNPINLHHCVYDESSVSGSVQADVDGGYTIYQGQLTRPYVDTHLNEPSSSILNKDKQSMNYTNPDWQYNRANQTQYLELFKPHESKLKLKTQCNNQQSANQDSNTSPEKPPTGKSSSSSSSNKCNMNNTFSQSQGNCKNLIHRSSTISPKFKESTTLHNGNQNTDQLPKSAATCNIHSCNIPYGYATVGPIRHEALSNYGPNDKQREELDDLTSNTTPRHYRFLTPPCTRKLHSSCMKTVPTNSNDYTALVKDNCGCWITSNRDRPASAVSAATYRPIAPNCVQFNCDTNCYLANYQLLNSNNTSENAHTQSFLLDDDSPTFACCNYKTSISDEYGTAQNCLHCNIQSKQLDCCLDHNNPPPLHQRQQQQHQHHHRMRDFEYSLNHTILDNSTPAVSTSSANTSNTNHQHHHYNGSSTNYTSVNEMMNSCV